MVKNLNLYGTGVTVIWYSQGYGIWGTKSLGIWYLGVPNLQRKQRCPGDVSRDMVPRRYGTQGTKSRGFGVGDLVHLDLILLPIT